jgi:pimeloyl-ACP methyl ester carboxylesterase
VRLLSARQKARIGDAGENGGGARRSGEPWRLFVERAIGNSRELAALVWPAKKSRTMTVLIAIGIAALCLYIGLAALLYLTQRSLMYFPETIHTAPAQAGLPEAEEVALTAPDDVHVIAWHVPPANDKPVIVYFHGNGGALRYRVERFRRLIADGIGLLALEYRGYGGLGGSPSERGLIADAEAAYGFAAAHYPPQKLVLWGESLGSGVAVAIAAEKPVGRVILEAPFTSAEAVGAEHYWYMPVRLLMKDQFRSDQRIGKVTAPLLILHGAQDRIVPYALGERLFDLANKPKHIVRFLDGGHEDLDANGALDAVGRFLAGDLD